MTNFNWGERRRDITKTNFVGFTYFKEPFEYGTLQFHLPLRVITARDPVQQVTAGRRSSVRVDLQRGLVGRERDEVFAIRAEFPQKARRLLDVDYREVGEHILVKVPRGVEVSSGFFVTEYLTVVKAYHYVLCLYFTRFN